MKLYTKQSWEDYAGICFDYRSGLRQQDRANLEKMISKAGTAKLNTFLLNLSLDCQGMFIYYIE